MRNITQHKGILKIIKRLDGSINGNPRFLISIDGFQCKTAVDSSYGYSVQNYDNKLVIATIGTHYNTATLNTLKPFPIDDEVSIDSNGYYFGDNLTLAQEAHNLNLDNQI
jgi:hypothetical protein